MNRLVVGGIRRINEKLAVEKKRKELIQKYPELYAIFQKYMKLFHAAGGYNYQQQDIKVLQLLDLLLQKRPRKTVEYGTGSTSLAFAYYATHYGASYLGLEESKEWSKANQERLETCIPNLKNARIQQSERSEDYSKEVYYSWLAFVPDEHYDFMLIDGPSFVGDLQHPNKINTDIEKYEKVGLPETIIVDNRRATVAWLKANLKAPYQAKNSSMWSLRKKLLNARNFQYYTVFESQAK